MAEISDVDEGDDHKVEDNGASRRDGDVSESKDPSNKPTKYASQADDADEDEEEEDGDYAFKWQDNGKLRNGRIEHDSVLLTLNDTTFRVSRDDFVLLWGADAEEDDNAMQTIEEIWQSAGCAKVEAMWEQPTKTKGRTKAMFRARWFFQKRDLSRLVDDDEVFGDMSLEELKKTMKEREVVESQEIGTYVMNTIGGPARVFFRGAPKEGDSDSANEAQLPKDAFMCRYSLKKVSRDAVDETDMSKMAKAGNDKFLMQVVPYEPMTSGDERDDQKERGSHRKGTSKKRRRSDSESDTNGGETSGQEGSSSDEQSKSVQDEGPTAVQGSIRLGPKYQVLVPPFQPNVKVSSRKPTLMWSASQTPDHAKIKEYFQKAADIITPFAKQQLLVAGTEPFTLKPPFQTSEKDDGRHSNPPWTVSFTSTAAALASLPPDALLRECDTDALLKNLHDQNYDIEEAVLIVSASPRDFLTTWTITERESFDTAFRTHGGSLRSVATALSSVASDKNHRQVIDYWYRFKIPGQFRKYRDKMREQAVRMIECIETKRSQEKEVLVTQTTSRANGELIAVSTVDKKCQVGKKSTDVGSWSETGTGDVAHAIEERRSNAKQLLLDIQREMGKDKMAEVAGAIISLNQGSEGESKGALLRILKDSPELHARLVEFLPRRFWK